MSKEDAWKLAQTRSLTLRDDERKKDDWLLEESGSSCAVSFDQSGIVLRKKKVIVTD
jgi:hypothetical protein